MSLAPTLFGYMKQCQRYIHDAKQQQIDPGDLAEYANRARREVAMRSQCVRILPPISGAIIGGSITAPGAGYTSPTVVISAPDYPPGVLPNPNGAQAVGAVAVIAGQIASFNASYGGGGYFQPLITINDPTGTGAVVEPILSPMNITTAGQEVYPFSGVPLANFPLVDSIIAVKSVSIIYANYRVLAAAVFFQRLPSNDPPIPIPIPVCPDVLLSIRSGQRRVALHVPAAVASLPNGMGLLLPAGRPDAGQRQRRGCHSVSLGGCGAALHGVLGLHGDAIVQ